MNDPDEPQQAPPGAGLCAAGRHRRVIVSDRGSRFLQCALAAVDPRFPRYPRLPVIACDGYAPSPAP
jgi:hypothetical protein